jgi:hypothetical protein
LRSFLKSIISNTKYLFDPVPYGEVGGWVGWKKGPPPPYPFKNYFECFVLGLFDYLEKLIYFIFDGGPQDSSWTVSLSPQESPRCLDTDRFIVGPISLTLHNTFFHNFKPWPM